MLDFYNGHKSVRVHLDLDISEETYNVQTTNNPFPDLIEAEVVEEFDMWNMPDDIYMTVPQLYEFCRQWYHQSALEYDIDFDKWFDLYLKSEIEALKSEEYDLTYYDSIKLFRLKEYLQQRNYKLDKNPVKCMSGRVLFPELSWALKGYFDGDKAYTERLTEVAQDNYIAVTSNISKINYLCSELVPKGASFLKPIESVEHIDFKEPRAIMYFVNPFTLTDSKTNFLYIRKLLAKVGKDHETNYSLHNADIFL